MSPLLALLLSACAPDAPAPEPAAVSQPAPQPAPSGSSDAAPVTAAAADDAQIPARLPTAAETPTHADGLQNGQFAADFELPHVDRPGTWRLSDHLSPGNTGPATAGMVGFVASWCGYCQKSLPTLGELTRDFGDDLVLVLLAVDDDADDRAEEARKVRKVGLDVPVLAADRATLAAWLGENERIPRFFVLSRLGQVLVQDRGFGDKVKPLMPKQLRWAMSKTGYVQR